MNKRRLLLAALLLVVTCSPAQTQTYNDPTPLNGYSIYYVTTSWNTLKNNILSYTVSIYPNLTLAGAPTGACWLPWLNNYGLNTTALSYVNAWQTATYGGNTVQYPGNNQTLEFAHSQYDEDYNDTNSWQIYTHGHVDGFNTY